MKAIKKKLEEEGYDVYIAIEQHSSSGFKENIFDQLKKSEYFLFIDFKREELVQKGIGKANSLVCRGSLFSHQELAVASYLGLEMLGFQEEGIEEHPGMMNFVMVNPTKFTDRERLPEMVVQEVKNNWTPDWRKELFLSVLNDPPHNPSHVIDHRNCKLSCYYHIKVKNNHNNKIATNCRAFILKLVNESSGKEPKLELTELKWKGVTIDSVYIPPGEERILDAFHIYDDEPSKVYLGVNPYLVDAEIINIKYQLGPGKYKISYAVFADGFEPAIETFIIEIDNNVGFLSFYSEKDINNKVGTCQGTIGKQPLTTTTSTYTQTSPPDFQNIDVPTGTLTYRMEYFRRAKEIESNDQTELKMF